MSDVGAHVWVSEKGPGPLVVVKKALLAEWRGVESTPGSASDYGRACHVGEVGAIEMKGGFALVLGDDPLRTTWLPRPYGGLFVRWIAADDEASAIAALDAGADSTWSPTGCIFSTTGGAHVLFPASTRGADALAAAGSSLSFELKEGDYDVTTTALEQGGASILVYRLTWKPKARR